jgi:hypothetical protein
LSWRFTRPKRGGILTAAVRYSLSTPRDKLCSKGSFGNAPIVFPAVRRVVVPYHPVFDAPLILLHASLAVRLLGDASGPGSGR